MALSQSWYGWMALNQRFMEKIESSRGFGGDLMGRLVIAEVGDGVVWCSGQFMTHDGKSTHSMTRVTVFSNDVEWVREPRVGDEIENVEKGFRHIPAHDAA
jgi:hypothetical protein